MKKKQSKKLSEANGDPLGSPTFQGGPYGFGGNRQLSSIDPSVSDITRQEEEEKDSNIDRLSWVLSKFRRHPQIENNENEILSEREASDQFYRNLPGFPPQQNPLVLQKNFVPEVDPMANTAKDSTSGEEVEHFGPMVDLVPIEDIDINSWLDLGPEVAEKILLSKEGFEEPTTEILNPGHGPMLRGANNFQLNSLSRPAIWVSSDELADIDDPVIPLGGMGAIGWPRKYVPDDFEQRKTQIDKTATGDLDLLNRKNIQMHQNPTIIPEENNYNGNDEVDGVSMEEVVLETEKKTPAEKHRVRRSSAASGLGLGSSALREIIEMIIETEINKVLPSFEQNHLAGTKAFEKNREEVLGDLHSDDESSISEAKFCIDTDEEIRQKRKKHTRPIKQKAWNRAKRIAKTEFGIKPKKRMMNWPSVRAVARAEELYRQAGGTWAPPKHKEKKAPQPTISLQEKLELFLEENTPNDKELWSRAKSAAKRKFDKYPSAYANAYAARWYKEKGGTWRKKKSKE